MVASFVECLCGVGQDPYRVVSCLFSCMPVFRHSGVDLQAATAVSAQRSFEPIQSYTDTKQPSNFGSLQYLNLISGGSFSLGVCFPFCKFGKIIFHCRITLKISQEYSED